MQDRIGQAKEMLGSTAGLNPLSDRHTVGYIQAYMDLLCIDYEDTQDD